MKGKNALIVFGFFVLGLSSLISRADAADGPLANETVSFGAWKTDEPLDRFTVPNPAPELNRNLHQLIPNTVTIKADGTVNYIFAGLHVIAIYDDGTQPGEINVNDLEAGITTAGGVIKDPTNRIYRGWNAINIPGTQPRERVDVVQFSKPGTYLVICALRNHFVDDKMFGFVRVLPGENK